MGRINDMKTLDPPEDPHVTTLYIGGLDPTITEADLKAHFYQYGELRNITVVQKQVQEKGIRDGRVSPNSTKTL